MIPIPLQPPIVSTIHAYVGQPPHAFFRFFFFYSFMVFLLFLFRIMGGKRSHSKEGRGERGKGKTKTELRVIFYILLSLFTLNDTMRGRRFLGGRLVAFERKKYGKGKRNASI